MAYNVFKRPMFKRGGSTQGTGIMSHVEPRVKAQGGAFTRSGNTLLFGRGQNLNEPLSVFGLNIPGTQIVPGSTIPKRDFASDLSFIAGPGKFMKAGGAGLNILKQAGRYATKPNFYGTTSGVSRTALEPAPFLSSRYIREGIRPYTSGMKETLKRAGSGIKQYPEATAVGIGGLGLGAYALSDDPVSKTTENQLLRQIENVSSNAANKAATGDFKKDAVYKEADKRTRLEKEADEIMKVLRDPDMDKAQAALLISDALKQGGSISDKITYAVNKGRKIAEDKAKDRRSAKLLAYQTIKKEDEAPAAGKIAKRAAFLASKENLSTKEKAELDNLRSFIDKETYTEKKLSGSEIDYYFANRGSIKAIEEQIQDLLKKGGENLTNLDDVEKRQFDNLAKEYKFLKGIEAKYYSGGGKTSLNLKDGGRVNYAEGTKPNDDLKVSEMSGDANEFPVKPVEKLSFEDLRNRLPQEITNDIVQLIANSEEALQDFAYISTQQDINDFNLKYGVNLVLPPQKG